MNVSKYFRILKPIGSHKHVVKLIEIKQLLSIVVIAIFILFEIGALTYVSEKVLNADTQIKSEFSKNIAVLNMDEEITSDYVHRLMDRVAPIVENKERFPELLVIMNSPGGSASASEEMFHFLEDIQKEGIKITMYVESMAASGGYWIATASQKQQSDPLSGIIANQNALVGSIGVIIGYPVIEEAAKKLGIKEKVITAGKYKHPVSPFKDPSKEEEAYLQSKLDVIYQNFLQRVAAGRGVSIEQIEPFADGKVFIASEVVGPLVDRVAYLYQIKKEIKKRVATTFDENDVGFVSVNTAKERKTLLDTQINLGLDTQNSALLSNITL